MRNLDRVTLCGISTRDLPLTEMALQRSAQHLHFGRVVVFSASRPVSPSLEHVAIQPFLSMEDYNRFVLLELGRHIETDFVLIIHFDGFVLNPGAWKEEFLHYDYIGARWPWHQDKQVGNGGFSLRSRRLLKATASPLFNRPAIPEDELICRSLRDTLEDQFKIRFAPPALADDFSVEHAGVPDASFGFHGLFHLHRAWRDEQLDEVLRRMHPSVYAGPGALLWFRALVGEGGHRLLGRLAAAILAAQPAEILARNCEVFGFPAAELALGLAQAAGRSGKEGI